MKVGTECPCMSHKTCDISIIDSIETLYLYTVFPGECIKQKTALSCFFYVSERGI